MFAFSANIEKLKAMWLSAVLVLATWACQKTLDARAKMIPSRMAVTWRTTSEAVLPAWWCWPVDTTWMPFFADEGISSPLLLGAYWAANGQVSLLLLTPHTKPSFADSVLSIMQLEGRVVPATFQGHPLWVVYRDDAEWCAWTLLDDYIVAASHAWLVEEAIASWRQGSQTAMWPASVDEVVFSLPQLAHQWKSVVPGEIGQWWMKLLVPFGEMHLSFQVDEIQGELEWKEVPLLSEKARQAWGILLQLVPRHMPLVIAGSASWLHPVGLSALPEEVPAVLWLSDQPAGGLSWGMCFAPPATWDVLEALGAEKADNWHMFPIWTFPLKGRSGWLARADSVVMLAGSLSALQRMLETLLSGSGHLATDEQWLADVGMHLPDASMWMRLTLDAWPRLYQQLGGHGQCPVVLPKEGVLSVVARTGGDGRLDLQVQKTTGQSSGNDIGLRWRVSLPKQTIGGPWVVNNQIIVQLNDLRLAVFDWEGTFQWALPLDGPVIGAVRALWLARAQQSVLLCHTGQHVLLLDGQGHHLSPSPFKLSRRATAPLEVVDFLANGQPWLFVPSGRNIQVYDSYLRPIEAWADVSMPTEIIWPVCHLQDATHDYLAFADRQGMVRVYNRLGQLRFELMCRDVPVGGPEGQVHRLSKRFVVPLSDGTVQVVALDGRSFCLRLPQLSPDSVYAFSFADVVGDARKDYVALAEKRLIWSGYERSAFRLWGSFSFAERPLWCDVLPLPKGKAYMACALPSGRLYVIDGQKGKPIHGQELVGQRAALLSVGQATCQLVAVQGKELMLYELHVD